MTPEQRRDWERNKYPEIESIAQILLGTVNSPEQEIYAVARRIHESQTDQIARLEGVDKAARQLIATVCRTSDSFEWLADIAALRAALEVKGEPTGGKNEYER